MRGEAGRAMVVASDCGLRDTLETLLRQAGFAVSLHERADEALTALLSQPYPDVIVAQSDPLDADGARLTVSTTPGQADGYRWPTDGPALAERLATLAPALLSDADQGDVLVLDTDAQPAHAALAAGRGVLGNLPIGLIQTRLDGRILAVNRACIDIGRCPDDHIAEYFGRNIRDLYADATHRDRIIDDLRRHGSAHGLEVAITRYDGTTAWISANARLVPNQDGEPAFITCSLIDITARHEDQEAMRVALAVERVRSEVLVMACEEDWWRVVRAVERSLRSLTEFGECSVNLIDWDTNQVSSYGFSPSVGDYRHRRDEIHPALRQAVSTGQAVVRHRGEPLFDEVLRADVMSVIDVPFDGGTVALNSADPAAFGQREADLLARFARVLTIGHRRLLDLAARAAAETALRESHLRYDELVRRIPVGVYVLRVSARGERTIEYCSPQLAAMAGHAAGEMEGDANYAFSMVHPDDYASFLSANIEASALNAPFCWEGRAIIGSQTRHVHIESEPTALPSGDVDWAGIVIDITERRLAEQELKRSQERYHSFVANSHEGIYCTEFDEPIDISLPIEDQIDAVYARGYLGECNAAMAALYGFDATEQFTGQRIADFHGGSQNPTNRAVFRRFIEGNYRSLGQETDEVLPSGEHRWFLSNDVGVVVEGRLQRIWGTCLDVTERRAAEEALQRRDALLAAAAAGCGLLLTEDDLWAAVASAVALLGEAAGQDRSYLQTCHPHPTLPLMATSLRYEWVTAGVDRLIDLPDMQNLPIEELAPHTWPKLRQGECVAARTRDLPPSERAILEPQGVKSLLLVPISVAGQTWGFLGFDDCTIETDWTSGEQAALTTVATAIGGAIERRQATEALRESLERNKALVDANPDMFFVVGADGIIRDAKTDRPDKLVQEAEAFIGLHAGAVLPAAVVPECLARVAEALASTEPVQFDYNVPLSDGPHDFECRLVRCGPDAVLAVVRDITDRARAEAERERLLVAIEQAEETIVITDAQGVIQYVNPMFERVTGFERAEALGRSMRMLEGEAQAAEPGPGLWQAIADGATWQGRLVNRRRDGSLFTEEATISPVRDRDGQVTNYVAVKRDITAQLSLEAQLAQARKLESVGRLAGGVAHDFNNMLGVILGHAETALDQVDERSPLRADLNEIRAAALRSADLTRQLLAFARRQTIAPRLLDLNETLSGTLKMLHRLIGEHIDLAWRPGANLWPVKVDPSQIDQILANLCVNARDAVRGSGRVTIETSNRTVGDDQVRGDLSPGDYVCLTVTDNGVGMDRETAARIFEPFFTTKGVGEGTGLGLATVYGAVRQNDGFIEVESAPGQGAAFTIYLPRQAGTAEPATPDRPLAPPTAGRGTILLVEDEPAILRMAQRMLARNGYTVLAAPTPAEALRLADEHEGSVDLLMTDVVMPEMNGRALSEHLRERQPGLKCLFMSGYTADTVAHHGVLADGVHFIAKPFTTHDLIAKVGEVLGP